MIPNYTETSTATIERIVAGGYGLGRVDGRVVLVPLTAPGDVVEIELVKSDTVARLVSVISAGPDRIEPPCPHYGVCGGCDLMHLRYDAQIEAKKAIVVESIERLGGAQLLNSVGSVRMTRNPKPTESRIRASWHPSRTGRAGYVKRRSHDIVEIERCLMLDPALEAARSGLRISGVTHGLTNGQDVSLSAGARPAGFIEFDVLGERLLGSADAFFQAGSALLDDFVGDVVALALRGRPEGLLELYSGIGLFTVPLASGVTRIDAVEASGVAVGLAKQNLRRAGRQGVTCHRASVERWLPHRHMRGERWDTVLVDPPRSGLNRLVVDAIVGMKPAQIVYVSCDPTTFARDARRLAVGSYQLTDVHVFDLFPQTHHVELVAAFTQS